MRMGELMEVQARCGAAARLAAGQSIRVVNTYGGQVVDLWAFCVDPPDEHMSMPHSVVTLGRIKPGLGSVLVTQMRNPILRLTADSSPGLHCMLFAACDEARYRLLGATGYHDNCSDNLQRALAAFEVRLLHIPVPLNLFMNTKFDAAALMTVEPPAARPGDSVTFQAEQDCVVALSACPQDLVPVNGHDCTPKAVHYSVF